MLQIRGLCKSYSTQTLFDEADLVMERNERLALVGRNGYGKSTLFRLLMSVETPDEGKVTWPREYRIGHLEQHLHFTEPTVLQEACLGLPEDQREWQTYKAESLLHGLGFTTEDFDAAPSEFSGGFQIRINLAKLLLSEPNLLLLDEPTNYLDIVSARWLKRFLMDWEGELIAISHDRDFLDEVCTHTALIHRQKIRRVVGNTGKLYEQIALEEEIHEKTRVNDEKKRAQEQVFIDRFRAKASKAKAVQSRIKRLDKLEKLEKLSDDASLDFGFRSKDFSGKAILTADNLSFGYDDDANLFSELSFTIGKEDRIGIIGKNGRGKSTLLKLIAGEMPPREGTIVQHPNAAVGYFGQTNIQRLDPKLTIEDEIWSVGPDLTRTQVRNICGLMMFGGDMAEKSVNVLSGGEKSRVLLGKILATPVNMLLLDEPTNHLDLESVSALTEALEDFNGAVVVVTHSEAMLRAVATKLIVFHDGNAEFFPGTYDDFLEKIGWEDEPKPKAKKPAEKSEGERKDNTRRRNELNSERTRVLTPIKRKIEELEAMILKLEEQTPALQAQMQAAAEVSDSAKIAEIGKKLAAAAKTIENHFDELAGLIDKHDSEKSRFDAEIAALS